MDMTMVSTLIALCLTATPQLQVRNQVTPDEKKQGFQLLFDGNSLDQFRGWKQTTIPPMWKAVDGEIRLVPVPNRNSDIVTKKEYADFDLRLDWKVEAGGNSGIFIRSDETKPMAWATGMEMQVLDNARHPDGKNVLTSAGSQYGMYAPIRDVSRPAGEWNSARILCKARQVTFWLNGVKVVSYVIGSPDWNARKAVSKYKDLPEYGLHPSGRIVLQDHGNQVSYRNIRIRVL